MSEQTKIDDGGSAFPYRTKSTYYNKGTEASSSIIEENERGMSLRDYFAAKADARLFVDLYIKIEVTNDPDFWNAPNWSVVHMERIAQIVATSPAVNPDEQISLADDPAGWTSYGQCLTEVSIYDTTPNTVILGESSPAEGVLTEEESDKRLVDIKERESRLPTGPKFIADYSQDVRFLLSCLSASDQRAATAEKERDKAVAQVKAYESSIQIGGNLLQDIAKQRDALSTTAKRQEEEIEVAKSALDTARQEIGVREKVLSDTIADFGIEEERCAALRSQLAKQKKVIEAAKELYNETTDYILVNNLGDIHHNASMKKMRDALAALSTPAEASENNAVESLRVHYGDAQPNPAFTNAIPAADIAPPAPPEGGGSK